MDYIEQIEKLLKYFKLSLTDKNYFKTKELVKKFNNDLNLLGCFFKDYLIVKNIGIIPADDEIYSDMVKHFNNKLSENEILDELNYYSDYYLSIVFEEEENEEVLNTIQIINSCFMLDAYPVLMDIMERYHHKKIDGILFSSMLKLLSDTVLNKFENMSDYQNDFYNVNKLFLENHTRLERLAG